MIAGSDRRSHDRGEEAIPPDGGSARAADPRAETTRTLTIGYLQVGPIEHGICRYGRLVASEGRRRQDLVILEHNTRVTGGLRRDYILLRDAARAFRGADMVHIQVGIAGESTWGKNALSMRNLTLFRWHWRRPLVVTLHDVNASLECGTVRAVLRRAAGEVFHYVRRAIGLVLRPSRRGSATLRRALADLWQPDHLWGCLIAHWVLRFSKLVLVLSSMEQDTLGGMYAKKGTVLIPHFIEEHSRPPRKTRAPSTSKTVIVAGFIFRSKGHLLMIEAMSELPDVSVIFVGGARLGVGGDDVCAQLMALARARGVDGRLRVTGYLTEPEYQRYLSSADLAVCPFEPDKSASGSLSTLIAASCPILASDIPLIAEYNALVPGAIPTFSPYTAGALAAAIRRVLAMPYEKLIQGFDELRERLSPSNVYELHLSQYRRLVEGPAARKCSSVD